MLSDAQQLIERLSNEQDSPAELASARAELQSEVDATGRVLVVSIATQTKEAIHA